MTATTLDTSTREPVTSLCPWCGVERRVREGRRLDAPCVDCRTYEAFERAGGYATWRRVHALRAEGLSLRKIGASCGISFSTVRDLLGEAS